MRTPIVAVALFATSAFAAAGLKSCTRSGAPQTTSGLKYPWANAENTTHHYANPDTCDQWKAPYCIIMNAQSTSFDTADEATHEYGCAECKHDCDCPIGKYCAMAYSEDPNFGTCVSYKDKLGKPCSAELVKAGDIQEAFYGSSMECALFQPVDVTKVDHVTSFPPGWTNSTHRLLLWSGACVNGYCRECNSWMLANPMHTRNDMFFTGSAQDNIESKTLYCLWPTIIKKRAFGAGGMLVDAPYKEDPRVCDNFGWSYTNGVGSVAPVAAAIIAITALVAL